MTYLRAPRWFNSLSWFLVGALTLAITFQFHKLYYAVNSTDVCKSASALLYCQERIEAKVWGF